MRILFTLLTALLAAAGLIIGWIMITGGLLGSVEFSDAGAIGDFTQTAGYPRVDSTMRFLGGIFFVVGLGFGYCLFGVEQKAALFFFLLLAIFVGGIARIIGFQEFGVIQTAIVPTAIELVFPPVMVFLYWRLSSQ